MRKPLRLSGLFVLLALPGLAAANSTPQTLPFAQDWTTDQLNTNDDWSLVPGISGFRGDDITTSTGVDPQTLLGADASAVADVNVNQTNPSTYTTGGVTEFTIGGSDRVVGLTGSGTADAPYLKIYLDLTGQANVAVRYDVRDLDASTDDATQQVALQYRVGNSGSFTNIPAAFVADATTASAATKVTSVDVELPDATDNQPLVELRIMTANASGNDEYVGIDDIEITTGAASPTDPSVDAVATPATVSAGGSSLLTATVTGGLNPASTGITVAGDLTAIGGSATAPFYDDATHGDATAGDGTYSLQVTVPAATGPGLLGIEVTATDAEARDGSDTITLSVAAKVTIPQIQGNGIASPLAIGTEVITEGVVTARRSNGYFIQSVKADADPTTSEGLFVFTSSAPPAAAAVGNRVRVAGRVGQFQRTPHFYPVTQLTNSSLTVLATGTTLPAPATINTFLSASMSPATLGRFQGMRVRLTSADVVGPTNAFGDFYVTRAGQTRPSREPGVAALDAVPLPPGNSIPVFDRNGERLRVESTGLEGGTALNVDNGTRLSTLEGVLYNDRGDFTLLIGDHSSLVVSGGAAISAVPVADAGSLRIGSFNIENLSGGANVNLDRLAKLSEVFCSYLRNPDIVGLVEIGDLATAERVAEAINTNEFGTCPDSPAYEAHLLSTSGSQRLGFLVKTAPAPGGATPRVDVLSVEEEFVGETLTNPLGNADGVLFDRAPLHLVARVTGDNGSSYDVDVVLNHTLSLLDVVDLTARAVWGTNGERARNKRLQQAVRVSQLVEEIQTNDPARPLVLIGDYNSFNFSDGYVDVMGIIGGTPAAVDTVLHHADSAVTTPLVNLIGTKPAAQRYSYVFEGNIQTLDHALVNQALLASADTTLYHARVNADFAVDNAADPTVPVRTSDHDPLVIGMTVPSFLDADLSVAATARTASVRAPNLANFNVVVANVGPMRALRPEVTLVFDAPLGAGTRALATGWTCSAPIADPAGSRVFCGRNQAMEPGVSETLSVQVRTAGPPTVSVSAEVDTRSVDTDAGNDTASATMTVLPAR